VTETDTSEGILQDLQTPQPDKEIIETTDFRTVKLSDRFVPGLPATKKKGLDTLFPAHRLHLSTKILTLGLATGTNHGKVLRLTLSISREKRTVEQRASLLLCIDHNPHFRDQLRSKDDQLPLKWILQVKSFELRTILQELVKSFHLLPPIVNESVLPKSIETSART
jgi:hypothetical protein